MKIVHATLTAAGKADKTRPLCRFPEVAKYKGRWR
jgi:hypothetical protein